MPKIRLLAAAALAAAAAFGTGTPASADTRDCDVQPCYECVMAPCYPEDYPPFLLDKVSEIIKSSG